MKQITFTLLLCIFSICAYAQQITVTGTVTDVEDNPLIGAAVVVVGTTNGVITDFDGKYTIKAEPGQTLKFSYVGYQEQVVKVNNRTIINVRMVEGEQLDEVVVIGYGTVKKSHLTGAVSSVSGKELQANVARSAASALQGRVTGVTVSSNSGQPGQGMTINIRGISSLSSTTPLYVIDGVYGDINMVDPSDIQSIEVLKDASAAAIYGSRAANGVVLITTKGGRTDMPTRVTVDAYTGIQNVAKKYDVMDGNQYRDFCKMYNINQSESEVTGWKGKGTDWQDELFQQASVSKVALNISGGSKTATFNVSGSYLKQDGIVKTTGYEAWNFRTKNTFSFFNNHVRVGNTFMMKFAKKDFDDVSFSEVLNTVPMQPVYDYENPVRGHWGTTPLWAKASGNPVGWAEAYDRQKHNIDLMLNGWAEVDLFLPGLKYKINVGINKYTSRAYNYVAPFYFSSAGQNADTQLDESTNWENDWLIENTLHYDQVFGKHSINVVAGYSAQRNEARNFGAGRKNMPEGLYVIDTGVASTSSTSGSTWRESLVSMFARAMYSYDDRYMASVSIRRDGSSKFADGNKWGSFPSGSIGWNIMNEDFFKGLKKTVNELKVRASYGVLGNLNGIGRYSTQSSPYMGLNGVFGGTWYNTGAITGYDWVTPGTTTWEKNKTLDFGLDLGLWNNKLTVSADYFIQKTEDMLLSVPQPLSFGLSGSPASNAGNVENKGFEIAVNHRNNIGELYYHIGVNASFLSNELTKVNSTRGEWSGYDPHGGGTVTYAKIGYPIGGFWLIKTKGIFQNQAEIDAVNKANGYIDGDGKYVGVQNNAVPGDLIFEDFDGNGKIDEGDKQYVGSAIPKVTLGFNLGFDWKGIDLNMFFDGQFGHKIYNAMPYYNMKKEGVGNYLTNVMNSWREDNKNTDIPRFIGASDDANTSLDNNGTNRAISDRWLENGDFFRLKTLELGYTLPKVWTVKAGLQNVRVYTAMENLFTITGYSGFTPDLGVNSGDGATGSGLDNVMSRGCDDGRYPLARTFSFGLQVAF
jgi:TonB-linked SusC/RagA family outer membrane protein